MIACYWPHDKAQSNATLTTPEQNSLRLRRELCSGVSIHGIAGSRKPAAQDHGFLNSLQRTYITVDVRR
ncbi:jg17653 [Pararge aegeria aegeria]|uniref:Jg17653 protein n=1 Tax=Pararge aegeria aegeria TaxID=348720 RepID=A0A8S4RH82_9NEOP|nr:jg17653 [Pararge aegeria aegeria]